jgi:hypothetical protein
MTPHSEYQSDWTCCDLEQNSTISFETNIYYLKSKWQRGPRADLQAPVLVSATRFTFRRQWYMPIVLWHGLRLRHAWGATPGAVGVSLAVDVLRRTTYTVSVWENQQHLHHWLHSPYHSELTRRYRRRVESSSAAIWQTDHFVLREAWKEAARRLNNW